MPASPAATPTGRQLVLVSLGHGTLMVLGGVLALLVAQAFGNNAETDAFFAAYAFYGVGLTLVQAFRLTAVSPLVADPGPATITRMLGAVAVICLVMAIPMVLLARPLGAVLVTSDPTDVAPETLRILWITLTGQLFAAMLAAVLAVRGAFVTIGVASLLSGFVSIATFLLLKPALGITSAAVALAASAGWLTLACGAVLVRGGWRPTRVGARAVRAMVREAGRLSYASVTFFAATLAYVISVAVAARQGTGEATLFAYAFLMATMLVGVTANVTAMVRSPALLSAKDRTATAAATGAWSFRFTLVLVGPVVAMALLIGRPVIGYALGSRFHEADVDKILLTLATLAVWILASAGSIFATVELLARGELFRLALLAVAQLALLTVLAIAGAAWLGIEGIGAALSITMLVSAIVQLRWAFGEAWRGAAAEMLRAGAREAAVLAASFGPAVVLLLLLGRGTGATVAAALLAAALAAVASAVAWPYEREALLGLARRAGPPALVS